MKYTHQEKFLAEGLDQLIDMMKTCAVSGQSFEITDEDVKFYDRIGVTPPTLCPEERSMRRQSWRNEFYYYKRTCNCCKRKVLSVYSLKNKFPVYCQSCWWSDKLDAKQYGRDFDFSRPFFEQFKELYQEVPQLCIVNDDDLRSENCEYCHDFAYGKNCYLASTTWHAEDTMYTQRGQYLLSVLDCDTIARSELSYSCMHCQHLYSCCFLQDSSTCQNCFLGINLNGCSDCFGCVGLRHKKYHILNKPYSKEEYKKEIKKFETGSYEQLQKIKKQFYEFSLTIPRRNVYQVNCEDCTGDCLFNCKEVQGHSIFNGEYCKYYDGGADTPKNSYDILVGGLHEWCYESIVPDHSYLACFSNYCWKCNTVFYGDNCHSSHDLFGCISLKKNEYCILNKQYSKEEYFSLREKIVEHMKEIGEWGEFFPIKLSPFSYNETVVQEYHSFAKEEALARGYSWKEDEPKDYKPATISTIPDNIADVSDSIYQEVLACESCRKNYQIQKQEFKFYCKMELPIPHKCSDCRHKERIELRNPRKLWERNCEKCNTKIQTTFAPDRLEIMYCEKCYHGVVD